LELVEKDFVEGATTPKISELIIPFSSGWRSEKAEEFLKE